jgi:hypothetical protein
MAQEYKTLGQITPSANVFTNLYVTGASTQAVVGTITISGLFVSSNSSYSIIVRPINEALTDKHFIFRQSPLLIDEVVVISGAVTMGPNTILAAKSFSGTGDFTAYGVEIT